MLANGDKVDEENVFVTVLKTNPTLSKERFEHLWEFLKEDAAGKVDGK